MTLLSRLHIASFGLLAGVTGQGLLYRPVFSQHLSWIIPFVVLPPWLIIYTITFCRVPPFGPKKCRRSLIFAMCWYAGASLLAETGRIFLHPSIPVAFPVTLARLFAYGAGLTFIVFVRACIEIRKYESVVPQ